MLTVVTVLVHTIGRFSTSKTMKKDYRTCLIQDNIWRIRLGNRELQEKARKEYGYQLVGGFNKTERRVVDFLDFDNTTPKELLEECLRYEGMRNGSSCNLVATLR